MFDDRHTRYLRALPGNRYSPSPCGSSVPAGTWRLRLGAILVGSGVWVYRAYGDARAGNRSAAALRSQPWRSVRENVTNRTELRDSFPRPVGLRAQVGGYLTGNPFPRWPNCLQGRFARSTRVHMKSSCNRRPRTRQPSPLELADKQVARTAPEPEQFATDELWTSARTSVVPAAVQTAEAAIRSRNQFGIYPHRRAVWRPREHAPRFRRKSGQRRHVRSHGSYFHCLTDPIWLDFDMSEADYVAYRHSRVGQPAEAKTTVQISLDGEQAWSRTGELNFLDNQIDRGSGTLHARATLSNPDLTIVPGQFARVRLPVSPARPALLIPDSAQLTDQSGKTLMVVQDAGTVVPKKVEIGALEDNGMRVITRGLLPTDRVIVNGLMRLRPGLKVEAHLAPLSRTTKN